jgi:hypothetical protein
MAEKHYGINLLTSWWPGSREIERVQGTKGDGLCDLLLPARSHQLNFPAPSKILPQLGAKPSTHEPMEDI